MAYTIAPHATHPSIHHGIYQVSSILPPSFVAYVLSIWPGMVNDPPDQHGYLATAVCSGDVRADVYVDRINLSTTNTPDSRIRHAHLP